MIDIDEFKRRCARQTADEIVDEVILPGPARHVPSENQAYLCESLARSFGLASTDIDLRIVGSAKLGFSISEKSKDGVCYPRYRSFSALSDIDTAVVSPKLFRAIWDELSVFAHGQAWMPWNSGKLGDYMVYGWLRPDHFPKGQRIRMCDNWWDFFRRSSRDTRFNRRSVRGGLFYSMNDLKRYLRRAVVECVNIEQGEI
jgi:hypothetical protein